MVLDFKRRAAMVLMLCVIASGCGEKPALPSNEADNGATSVATDILSSDIVDEADRKPRKILSPDEKRRVTTLLKIYRESRPTGSADSDENAENRLLAQEALDRIDPKIMEAERRREAALDEQQFDKRVDALIRQQGDKPAATP